MDDGHSQVKGQASLVPEEEVFVSPGALSFQIIPHYISYVTVIQASLKI